MKPFRLLLAGAAVLWLAAAGHAQAPPIDPQATPEARQLLAYLYKIQGHKTLSGIHNVLGRMSASSDKVHELTGKYPAVWGGDFGFADSTHDIDNIKYRPLLVPEIKRQHARGSIIVLSYHQANPAIGEPCPFEGGIISKLTDAQWQELLTPGTPLYQKWAAQMDLLAGYLRQLQDAHIPVIFRPYHEMNGGWFWWGARPGPTGYAALWQQLYAYYTGHHQLHNILWAWTPDKPTPGVEAFFPGVDKVDLLGTDIYPRKDSAAVVYPQRWYAAMHRLAAGKPLGLSEQSQLPTPAQLRAQPFVWFMSWGSGGLLKANSEADVRRVYDDRRVVSTDQVPARLRGR